MKDSRDGGRWYRTLHARMLLGALAFIGLLGTATYLGYSTLERLTLSLEAALGEVERSTWLTQELDATIRQQVEAGYRYLETGDGTHRRTFEELSRRAGELSARFAAAPGLLAPEQTSLAAVERARLDLEIELSTALGRGPAGSADESGASGKNTDRTAAALQAELAAFGTLPGARLAQVSAELRRAGDSGRRWLIAVFFVSGALATWLVFTAIRAVNQPLLVLGAVARRVGEGDLTARVADPMLHEFDVLAGNFNSMSERLSGFVRETTSMSEQIAMSAQELAIISEQVATSSKEVAAAMTEITRAAEGQSTGLNDTCTALDEMRRRSGRIDEAGHRVVELTDTIRELAEQNRDRMAEATRLIFELSGVVGESEAGARDLASASSRIDDFVEMISLVARQTNLLALNAAIEAARAGDHGRGFAVVAEEVRKLADNSADAAREVAGVVDELRSRIDGMVSSMEGGARQVERVEEVARGAEEALERIMGSVGDVRDATIEVNDAIFANWDALGRVEAALADVAGAAESHAASAQQVSAAAEQQSAATEQVSAASGQLLDTAGRMRALVSGLRA